MAYKWSPNQCVKDAVNANQVLFFSFFARAFAPNSFAPNSCDFDLKFQFMATIIMSMATRSRDLEDQSGGILQTEDHMGMESQYQKDPEEMGVLGSYPSHLPSWSLARGPSPNCPNTRYCLGIHMT